jgi:hypothetical protein
MPNAEQIADIAEEAAGLARRLGYEPRVAMLAYSTFGHPAGERSERVQEAVKILDRRRVDFEYDGEMAADVALNPRLMQQYTPSAASPARATCWSCRPSTRRRSRRRCCRNSAAPPSSARCSSVSNKPVQIVLDGRQGLRHRQHGGDCGV